MFQAGKEIKIMFSRIIHILKTEIKYKNLKRLKK